MQIVAARVQDLYQLHNNGEIWKYSPTGQPWDKLDDNPATVQIVAAGTDLYQLHNNGEIWKYSPTGQPWDKLDDNPATVQIVAGPGVLYQLHDNSTIWVYLGTAQQWLQIGDDTTVVGNVLGMVAGAEGLFQLRANGGVWSYSKDYAHRLTVHARVLATPTRDFATMLANMRQVYDGAGIRVDLGSTEQLGPVPQWLPIDNNPATTEIVANDIDVFPASQRRWDLGVAAGTENLGSARRQSGDGPNHRGR